VKPLIYADKITDKANIRLWRQSKVFAGDDQQNGTKQATDFTDATEADRSESFARDAA
jgi:hypothetical protein